MKTIQSLQAWLAANHPEVTIKTVTPDDAEYSTVSQSSGDITPNNVHIVLLLSKDSAGKTTAFELPESVLRELQSMQDERQGVVKQKSGKVVMLTNGDQVITARGDEQLAGEEIKPGDIITYRVRAKDSLGAFLEKDPKSGRLIPHPSKLYLRPDSTNTATGKLTEEQLYGATLSVEDILATKRAQAQAVIAKHQAQARAFTAIGNLLSSGNQDAETITRFVGLVGLEA